MVPCVEYTGDGLLQDPLTTKSTWVLLNKDMQFPFCVHSFIYTAYMYSYIPLLSALFLYHPLTAP